MQYANLTEKLTAYIQAGFPAFYVQTAETERADALIAQVAEKLSLNVMEYNLAVGKVNFQNKAKLAENAGRLENSLKDLYDEDLENQIILIKNAKLALENNPVAISRLLHLIEKAEKNNQQSPSEPCTIILQSAELFIPADIEPYITVLELPLPQDKEIQQLVKNQFNSLDKHLVNRLSTALSGLNELEIKKLLILIKNRFPKIENNIEEIFSEIQSQKEQIIAKSGVLGMVKGTNNIDDIGGLENLKQWLKEQNEILTHLEEAQHFGVKAPKGVLIAGMPGCGKSLTAKAASTLFQQPLLRLDIGSLLGKYVGESETNMRKALAMAESISPCVLWVDELEKAFVGMTGNNSSEVSSRLLGYFLTWMQEKTKPVFIVATANDITALPPELLRKGRFDEIFYVGFPNTTERKAILTIHLTKAKQNVEEFDLVELAQSCRDYSGADIENTVYEAVKKAFLTQNKTLTQAILLEAIKNTIPLRKTMKDKVGEYEKKFDELYLTAASDSEDLSIAKMIRMSESTNYLDRLKVAESEDATEDLLIKLSNDSNETVKLATLYNNNCPTSVLIKEFESGYESVVLRHKNFPFDLAIEYFKDGNKSNFAWFAHYNPNIIDKNNLITLLKSMKNKNLQTILGAYLSHPRLEEEEKKILEFIKEYKKVRLASTVYEKLAESKEIECKYILAITEGLPSEIYEPLINHSELHKLLAQNSSLPISLYKKLYDFHYVYNWGHAEFDNMLSENRSKDMKKALAKNKSLPEEIYILLAKDSNSGEVLATRNDLPEKVYEILLKNTPSVRSILAQNKYLSMNIYYALANDEIDYVRSALAENNSLPIDIYAILVNDKNFYVREELTYHSHLPIDILIKLANDKDEDIQYSFATNIDLSIDFCTKNINSKNKYMALAISKKIELPLGIIMTLLNDKDEKIKIFLAENSILPEHVSVTLANSQNSEIRTSLAKNKNLSKKVLLILANHQDSKVRKELAINENLPTDIYYILLNDNHIETRERLCWNNNLPLDIYIKLAQDENHNIREKLSCNLRNIPIGIQKKVINYLKNDYDEYIRNRVENYDECIKNQVKNYD